MISIPEMNNLASGYDLEVKGIPSKGVYLVDGYKNRYERICSYRDLKKFTKDDLMFIIHKFAEKLRPKHSKEQ